MTRIYKKGNGDQIIVGSTRTASRYRQVTTPPPNPTDPVTIGLLGQSELEHLLNSSSFYRQIASPALLSEDLTYLADASPTGGTTPIITQGSVTQATKASLNPAYIAMANMLGHFFPGRTVNIVDLAVQGTGLRELLDDAQTGRSWSVFSSVVSQAVTSYGGIDLVCILWWNSVASQLKTWGETFSPGIFGQRWNGTSYTLGTAVTDGAGGYDADHCLWDITAASSAAGRGIFTRDGTSLTILGPGPRLQASTSVEGTNYATTSAVATQSDRPARDKLEEFMNDTRVQTFGSGYGISTHVCKFGDNYDSGSGATAIHPSVQTPDGQYLFAQHIAVGLAKALGATIYEPTITGLQMGPGNAYADVIVDLPNNGTLTTIRKLRSQAAPSPAPPHYQPVMGFEIGANSNNVVPLGFTADIVDTGTGTAPNRTGRVRITPTSAFATGSVIEYLRGTASCILLDPRDMVAALYKDMLVENVPSLVLAGETHTYPGIPVKPQPPALVIPLYWDGVTGNPSQEQVELIRTDGSTRGVRSGVTLKTVGVDALPAGVTISGQTINVAGTGVVLDSWDFKNYRVVFKSGCQVTEVVDCVFRFDPDAISWSNSMVEVETTANIGTIHWCSFLGAGYLNKNNFGIIALRQAKSGTGATVISAPITKIDACEWFGFGTDYLKTGNATTITRCYFDPCMNVPVGTLPWSSATTYNIGDWALSADGLRGYVSLTNGNQNNALPPDKSDNANWQNLDPHYDSFNPRVQVGAVNGLLFKGNYVNRAESIRWLYPWNGTGAGQRSIGINNGIRADTDSTGELHRGGTFSYNIITARTTNNQSYPIQSDPVSDANRSIDTYTNNWVGPTDGAAYYHPTTSGHNLSGFVTYSTPTSPTTAGYTGPALT